MLHDIQTQGVGPGESMRLDLAPRLNLIAGDNGLGKSFVLDLAWWLLTRSWAGPPIRPAGPPVRGRPKPFVSFTVDKAKGVVATDLKFDWPTQEWKRPRGRPPSPGLVLYARVDGGFGVWDPARNYWRDAPTLGVSDADRPAAFLFDTRSIWDGLTTPEGRVLCKGLLQDWVDWQLADDPAFKQLTAILAHLSPNTEDALIPGTPAKVTLDDVRDVPTLQMAYGAVPIIHASAGMRRVAAIAYLLVWSFREHLRACAFLGRKPEHRIIFLIDEIEAHLHPKWQRAILPAFLDVTKTLAPDAQVQIIATTHSPFVPLSVEAEVDDEDDALWEVDLEDRRVVFSRAQWERRGDAMGWATSPLFDLSSTRSREAEGVVRDIEALMARTSTPSESVLTDISQRMQTHIPITDGMHKRWADYRATLAPRPAVRRRPSR